MGSPLEKANSLLRTQRHRGGLQSRSECHDNSLELLSTGQLSETAGLPREREREREREKKRKTYCERIIFHLLLRLDKSVPYTRGGFVR